MNIKNYINSNKELSRLPVKSEELIQSYTNLLNESGNKEDIMEGYQLKILRKYDIS